jgi:hypothetical protein
MPSPGRAGGFSLGDRHCGGCRLIVVETIIIVVQKAACWRAIALCWFVLRIMAQTAVPSISATTEAQRATGMDQRSAPITTNSEDLFSVPKSGWF